MPLVHEIRSFEQDHPRDKRVAVKDSNGAVLTRKELENCTIAVLCPTHMTDVKKCIVMQVHHGRRWGKN